MKTVLSIILCSLLFSCGKGLPVAGKEQAPLRVPAVFISSTDTALQWSNGVYYYRRLPFSGHLIEKYENNMVHADRSYYNGREEGWQFVYYPGGALSEKRYYHGGEKDSVHTGWWPGGQPRFEYHFSKGIYHGDFKEWYANGRPYQHIHYTRGMDDRGKGWRQNGKVYMSYITRNNRRYGLINANLCYTLTGENGEFTRSVIADPAQ
jgi:hypothetical protein